jgi:hypothetical protein
MSVVAKLKRWQNGARYARAVHRAFYIGDQYVEENDIVSIELT